MKVYGGIKRRIKDFFTRYQVKGKTKYFCIGRNKTGTSSIGSALKDLNIIVGNQEKESF